MTRPAIHRWLIQKDAYDPSGTNWDSLPEGPQGCYFSKPKNLPIKKAAPAAFYFIKPFSL
jgi:hypothetical protein